MFITCFPPIVWKSFLWKPTSSVLKCPRHIVKKIKEYYYYLICNKGPLKVVNAFFAFFGLISVLSVSSDLEICSIEFIWVKMIVIMIN